MLKQIRRLKAVASWLDSSLTLSKIKGQILKHRVYTVPDDNKVQAEVLLNQPADKIKIELKIKAEL